MEGYIRQRKIREATTNSRNLTKITYNRVKLPYSVFLLLSSTLRPAITRCDAAAPAANTEDCVDRGYGHV